MSLTTSVTPIPASPLQREALAAINRLRPAQGLPPVRLDQALSAGCTAHAKYLALHSWSGRENPHGQNLGPEGASPEGKAAAERSAIGRVSPAESIGGYWATYYHRVGFMCPWLDKVGINAEPATISVVDVANAHAGFAGGAKPEVTKAWAEPCTVPADGAEGIPVGSVGELPSEPVTDLRSRGFSVMAVFRAGTKVEGFRGTIEEVRGGQGSWVQILPADPGGYPHVQGIVPRKPLSSKTAYKATLTWTVGGKERGKVVRFTTE